MVILYKITKTDNTTEFTYGLVNNETDAIIRIKKLLKEDNILKVRYYIEKEAEVDEKKYEKLAALVNKYFPMGRNNPQTTVSMYYKKAVEIAASYIRAAEDFMSKLCNKEVKYEEDRDNLIEVDNFISKYIDTTVKDIKIILTIAGESSIITEKESHNYIKHNYQKALNIGEKLYPNNVERTIHSYAVSIVAEEGTKKLIEAIDYIKKCGEELYNIKCCPFKGGGMCEYINQNQYDTIFLGRRILKDIQTKLDTKYHDYDTWLTHVAKFIKWYMEDLTSHK
nr:MAG TPA: hypothetical protein [Crassvirales sp.]